MDAILKGVLHVPRLLGAQDDNINFMKSKTDAKIKFYAGFVFLKLNLSMHPNHNLEIHI